MKIKDLKAMVDKAMVKSQAVERELFAHRNNGLRSMETYAVMLGRLHAYAEVFEAICGDCVSLRISGEDLTNALQ